MRTGHLASTVPVVVITRHYMVVWLLTGLTYFGIASHVCAEAPAKLDPAQCASSIDTRFAESWKQSQVEPAAATTDTEFVRRVYLDLIGRIPSVAEVREFLEDKRSDKRIQLVEELLQR